MKITNLDLESSNDCGGFKPPKGHMDTQMYPECEGYETDRDIVKKTVDKRKNKKKKASISRKAKHGSSVEQLWRDWATKAIDSQNFVEQIIAHIKWGWIEVSKDPTVRLGIKKAINQLQQDGDYDKAASAIASSLSVGQHVEESLLEPVVAKKKEKKKEWDPNPWAICEVSVGKDENPEKFERCVKKVKKQQAFNLKKHIESTRDSDVVCGSPCDPESPCDECEGYWGRMKEEGLWVPGQGWTDRAKKEWKGSAH